MRERVFRYDIIRIVAIILVLLLHCSTRLASESPDINGYIFHAAIIINEIGRAGVPLFLMLTGALLLDEDKPFDTRRFYKKSLLGVATLLIFWLIFYASWYAFILPGLGVTTNTSFIKYILMLNWYYPHLWYLFMLIGAYLAVPFLRLFVKKENKNYILGFILTAAVAQFFAKTAVLFKIYPDYSVADLINRFHLEYATGYLPYLLAGWYIVNFPPKKEIRIIIYLAGVTAVITAILAVSTYFTVIPNIHKYVMERESLPAFLYGISVFTFICSAVKKQTSDNKLIKAFSKSSFGVYIIHVVVLDILTNIVLPFEGFWTDIPVLYILAVFVLTYSLSLCIVLPLSHVSGVKKLFHY